MSMEIKTSHRQTSAVAGGDAGAEERRPILSMFGEIDEQLANLFSQLDQLEKRLTPILTPPEGEETDRPGAVRGGLSPIALELSSASTRLRIAVWRVNRIGSRLEC